jgi:GntR family transcriptional regulator
MPFYERIKQALRARIREGALPPHTVLPSYRELCELTGASRITVRRAVSDLCDEGVLYTLPGKGIFVAGVEREFEMAPFVGMTDEFAQRSQFVASTWLERTMIGAPAHLSALLAVLFAVLAFH